MVGRISMDFLKLGMQNSPQWKYDLPAAFCARIRRVVRAVYSVAVLNNVRPLNGGLYFEKLESSWILRKGQLENHH